LYYDHHTAAMQKNRVEGFFLGYLTIIMEEAYPLFRTGFSMYFNQDEFQIHCEWGLEAVKRLAPTSGTVVIVDVISFTTCVDVAISRGGQVYPYPWRDERSIEFARSTGAILATSSRKDPGGFSLAPSSMLHLPRGTKVVLPSPNGATLSLATGTTPTFAGCLRNAPAVAAAAAATAGDRRITIIPAGERWEDGSLRPALEDWMGAGAILHALQEKAPSPGRLSPEAEVAVAVFLHFRQRLFETLAACSSGKEAADRGSIEDIHLAADWNASQVAPRLVDGAYCAESI
jgi:2-phosphosulfolactate phosphatase